MNLKDIGGALSALQEYDGVETCEVCGGTTLVEGTCVDCVEDGRLVYAPGGYRQPSERRWTRGYMLRRIVRQLFWALVGGAARDWREHQRVVAERRAQEAARKVVLP